VVLGNVEHEDVRQLLPSRRTSRAVLAPRDVSELTGALEELGFVVPAAVDPVEAGDPAADPMDLLPASLAGEAATLRARTGSSTLVRRRLGAVVAVHGPSRLLAPIATTLAAAGVGSIRIGACGEVTARDACPAGLTPADEGRRFLATVVDAVQRAAPAVEVRAATPGVPADLVIVTGHGPVEETLHEELNAAGSPHLQVSVEGAGAVIGPLVIPGETSCLRCCDLHRTDRDPAWPALAVQLSVRSRHRLPTDGALCVAVAGLSALQALAHLDGEDPATRDGTLELHLPDWRLRRRSWPPHPACPCRAATVSRPARQNGGVSDR
jgi:bacteriocin biosynthesis cyclodehydratase domain-containing protein